MENEFVYVWRDDNRKVAHAWHSTDRDSANIIWKSRYDSESGVNDWLRQLALQPDLDKSSSLSWPMHGTEARTAVRTIKTQLKELGFKILSSRDRGTIVNNEGEARPVYVKNQWAENGWSWFPSVRAAAKALGLDQSAVTLAAQHPKRSDILYADEADDVAN